MIKVEAFSGSTEYLYFAPILSKRFLTMDSPKPEPPKQAIDAAVTLFKWCEERIYLFFVIPIPVSLR
jgi:hypothetical protein